MNRVAIYNRCSTEEENQKNALAIQAAESSELAEHMGWLVVEQYVEAQSGTSVSHRKEYKRMLEDMEDQRFDTVIIKSIDRLARNTKDWYLFLDSLTRNEIRLYLYLERKFYVSEDALVSGIKAILAEEFSKELSQKIKNAHKRRQEKGLGLNITREMYGWKKVAKDCYEINEEEAEYIKKAFELVEKGYGYRRISNELFVQGARNSNGERISETQWRNILRSPRIHGTVILNTTTYDFERKKRIQVPQEQWIYMKHALPEIVSRKYHEKMLSILDQRKTTYDSNDGMSRGRNQKQYPLSHKILCDACGSIYYRTTRQMKEEQVICWKCSTYVKMGAKKADGKGCDNAKLKEKELYASILKAYEQTSQNYPCINDKNMEQFWQMLGCALQTSDSREDQQRLQRKLEKLQKEEDLLVEKLLRGVVEEEQFCRYIEKQKGEKEQLSHQIETFKQETESWEDGESRVNSIQAEVAKGDFMTKTFEELAVEQVEQMIVCDNKQLKISWRNKSGTTQISYDDNKIVEHRNIASRKCIEHENTQKSTKEKY